MVYGEEAETTVVSVSLLQEELTPRYAKLSGATVIGQTICSPPGFSHRDIWNLNETASMSRCPLPNPLGCLKELVHFP